jgi:hypothetical protein
MDIVGNRSFVKIVTKADAHQNGLIGRRFVSIAPFRKNGTNYFSRFKPAILHEKILSDVLSPAAYKSAAGL